MRCILLMLLLVPATTFSADDFGRLFTTPGQRESLNHLRKTAPRIDSQAVVPEAAVNEVLPPALPSSISVQGYVKRSDGKRGTVWINNTPIQENSSTGEVEVGKVTRGNQVPLKVPGIGSVNLKAGQIYDPETGRVVEVNSYQGNSEADADAISSDLIDTPNQNRME